ncbi:hypothetical protein IQ277_29640 [Nostocales cyanobacterium LEGE 12452]|nr:hypothetical protein [Nostocales cyanobacterium LEGE 12452]
MIDFIALRGYLDILILKIKRFTVVGFGLEIINLSNEDSLTLLRYGIGGKRKMGCGVFVPVKRKGNAS